MRNKTAKEWLQEEELYNGKVISKNLLTNQQDLDIILERFANYRTADMQAAVLNFRHKVINYLMAMGENADYSILEEYDEHFGITEARNGEI